MIRSDTKSGMTLAAFGRNGYPGTCRARTCPDQQISADDLPLYGGSCWSADLASLDRGALALPPDDSSIALGLGQAPYAGLVPAAGCDPHLTAQAPSAPTTSRLRLRRRELDTSMSSSLPSTPAGKVFPPLMTLQQVADLLVVSNRTVSRLVAAGKLPCYRLSDTRARRFRRDDIERLLVPETAGASQTDDLGDFITSNMEG